MVYLKKKNKKGQNDEPFPNIFALFVARTYVTCIRAI